MDLNNKEAHNRIDLVGIYFSRLKVLFYYDTYKKHARWFCECVCGNFKVIQGLALRKEETKSCGCIQLENKDIYSHKRLHKIWKNMKSRCYYEKGDDYHRYGGRGIIVCEEWKGSFKKFAEWSFNSGYKENLTIDRKNNDGNYEPSNCRWVTRQIQSNNMSSNNLVTFNNKTQSLADWSRETGICADVLYHRLEKYNWSKEESFLTPVGEPRSIISGA